jgi:hypothetical protein
MNFVACGHAGSMLDNSGRNETGNALDSNLFGSTQMIGHTIRKQNTGFHLLLAL